MVDILYGVSRHWASESGESDMGAYPWRMGSGKL
jgi:hypothetical protein